MAIKFEWDRAKSLANQRKHRISFEEAQSIFIDEKGLLLDDPDNSGEEERFVLLGMSAKLKILVVCHWYQKSDKIIRIIFVREATPSGQKQ